MPFFLISSDDLLITFLISDIPSNPPSNASFGSNIGDPLCCEQPGVVQNTKFICPSELPSCMGYKCGESWGKCTMRTNLSE